MSAPPTDSGSKSDQIRVGDPTAATNPKLSCLKRENNPDIRLSYQTHLTPRFKPDSCRTVADMRESG